MATVVDEVLTAIAFVCRETEKELSGAHGYIPYDSYPQERGGSPIGADLGLRDTANKSTLGCPNFWNTLIIKISFV